MISGGEGQAMLYKPFVEVIELAQCALLCLGVKIVWICILALWLIVALGK